MFIKVSKIFFLGKNKTTSNSEELYNCQILACPENSNYSTLVNDSRYDYYSMYAQPLCKYYT